MLHFRNFIDVFRAVSLMMAMIVTPVFAQAEDKQMIIGTAGVTGVYYPVGGTICRFIDMKSKEHGINCLVETTGGSISNLNALREGDIQFAFAQSDWQYNAYHGTSAFADRGAFTNLRSLFSLHSEALTLVARMDSGIKVLDDLRGKRVNVGNPGSGMRATMDEVIRAKGWDLGVFKSASQFRATEQTKKLCDNKIDAFVFATGHPNGSIQEVTSSCPARLISVEGPEIEQLIQEYPYYAPATIPGGMYAGNPNDVATFGVKATLVTTKDVDDELVYQVVKSVFDNFDDFKTTHPILSTLTKRAMIENGLTAPLHAGAKRYYREAGLIQ
ncbi:MAG: TAXI family TRAP transporter solute-binding subunit [Rickettsiales bacterium]|nr:TAXI family TRAP transporter solute-binding subunit [Rickettsiales bacterium]